MIRVLSIDGGGIRGMIPATILAHLEREIQLQTGNSQAKLIDYFDFLAGTSTGGIITAILNSPKSEAEPETPKYSAQDLIRFYEAEGPNIFKSTWFSRIFSSVGLTSEKYDVSLLEDILSRNLGKEWLSHMMKPCLIPAFNLATGRTHFFCPHDHQQTLRPEKEFLMRDVCRATSAAPSYFEPATIKNANAQTEAFIDGGVFANNPTLCAIAEVGKANGAYSPRDMFVLSLGTGRLKANYSVKRWKKAAALLIIPDLLNIMMDGVSETTHFITKKLFDNLNVGNQYIRIDPLIEDVEVAQMDNASPENIAKLRSIGEGIVSVQTEEIKRIATALIGAQSTKRDLMAPTTSKLIFQA